MRERATACRVFYHGVFSAIRPYGVHVGARNHHEAPRSVRASPLALSQARQAPALNVIHFIVVTDVMSRVCILMHGGAPSDA
jgi:hypothetical protein